MRALGMFADSALPGVRGIQASQGDFCPVAQHFQGLADGDPACAMPQWVKLVAWPAGVLHELPTGPWLANKDVGGMDM